MEEQEQPVVPADKKQKKKPEPISEERIAALEERLTAVEDALRKRQLYGR